MNEFTNYQLLPYSPTLLSIIVCVYLIDILEALVCQGDGDGEDGVGGVLVKTCFIVTSEQSQGPAPTAHTHPHTNTHTQTHTHTLTYMGRLLIQTLKEVCFFCLEIDRLPIRAVMEKYFERLFAFGFLSSQSCNRRNTNLCTCPRLPKKITIKT